MIVFIYLYHYLNNMPCKKATNIKLDVNSFVLYYMKDEVFLDEENGGTDAKIAIDIVSTLKAIDNKQYKTHTIKKIGNGETIQVEVFLE